MAGRREQMMSAQRTQRGRLDKTAPFSCSLVYSVWHSGYR